jgi:TolB-like protein
MVHVAVVALMLAALPASAPERAGPARSGPPSFAVLPFDLPEPFRDRRDALVTLVAARLERGGGRVITRADVAAMLGFEQEKARLDGGCGDRCAEELTGALGVRYVVNGQVAPLGGEWIVALALYDKGTVRRHAERVGSDGDFAAAFERGADSLAAMVRIDEAASRGTPLDASERGQVSLTAGGSSLLGKLKFEYGYPLLPELWAVAQGSLFVSNGGTLSAVPAGVGLKYVFAPDHRVRPYVGAVVGVAVANGEASFHLMGTAGLWIVVWRRAGLLIETSADSASVEQSPEGHTIFSGTATAGFTYAW